MESKGLGVMVTLQLYKQNLDSFLDRNSSEQPDLEQIWLWWSFSLEILKMKCNEFFTMSAELPLRENEMSSKKADKL